MPSLAHVIKEKSMTNAAFIMSYLGVHDDTTLLACIMGILLYVQVSELSATTIVLFPPVKQPDYENITSANCVLRFTRNLFAQICSIVLCLWQMLI